MEDQRTGTAGEILLADCSRKETARQRVCPLGAALGRHHGSCETQRGLECDWRTGSSQFLFNFDRSFDVAEWKPSYRKSCDFMSTDASIRKLLQAKRRKMRAGKQYGRWTDWSNGKKSAATREG